MFTYKDHQIELKKSPIGGASRYTAEIRNAQGEVVGTIDFQGEVTREELLIAVDPYIDTPTK